MSRAMEVIDADQVDPTVMSSTALATITATEIDQQIGTAKAYPRSLKAFKNKAMEYATLDEDTAASMYYVLRRGKSIIEGPTIRMAEIVMSTWGNLRCESYVTEIGQQFVTAQATCFDLEANIAMRAECKRRITDKSGRRYNEDMIQVTCQAACSIALRNAILRVVPRAMIHDIYEAAKKCSLGDAKSMTEMRHKAFEWLRKYKATDEQVLAFLGRQGIEDVTLDDLTTLRGLCTSIKEGMVTIEEALRAESDEPKSKAKVKPLEPKEDTPPEPEVSDMDRIYDMFAACKTSAEVDRVYDELLGPEGWAGAYSAKISELRQQMKDGLKGGKKSQKEAFSTNDGTGG